MNDRSKYLLVAVGALVVWWAFTMFLLERIALRPIFRALTGAVIDRRINNMGSGHYMLDWSVVNRDAVRAPGAIELLYWALCWFVAIVLPLGLGLLWLYIDWKRSRGQ